MGIFLSRLWSTFEDLVGNGDPWNILMLGLDNAGKTTIVYKLKLNENIATIPTIGFNVETVTPCKGVTFTIWDVGGQEAIRRLWRHYYSTCKGLVFVVDSNDPSRFVEAADELRGIIESPEMPKGVPILILANKQDLPQASRPSAIADKLQLHSYRSNKWFVQGCTACSGDGLQEGLEVMAQNLREYKRNMGNSTF